MIAATSPFAWIIATLVASSAQVLRNGAQSELTARLGTLGATHVRFLYGMPFAIIALAVVVPIIGGGLPHISQSAFGWAVFGAITQIGATAFMLMAMHQRGFSVAYAYIKTEPVTVALFGVALLGDYPTLFGWIGMLIATAGVVIASVPGGRVGAALKDWQSILLGVISGGLFGVATIGFRATVLALPAPHEATSVLSALTLIMAIQTVILLGWLLFFDRPALQGSLSIWRSSLGVGFLGAFASAAWIYAYAHTAAVNVRTLALVELPLAALFSYRMRQDRLSRAESAGIAFIMIGVALLVWGSTGHG